MTREEIIRMAREAGLQHREAAEELYSPHCDGIYLDDLERFAALVAAAEREACAEEAETPMYRHEIAAKIRERGKE